MSLSFCSISSGSSGNCYLIKTEETALLVDAGISGKRILEGLAQAETDPEIVKALLVTHEHIDHVKSVKVLTKRIKDIKVYANLATWDCICKDLDSVFCSSFNTGESLSVGDIEINTFATCHDATEPVGYTFSSGGKKLSIVTDTGCVTEEIYDAVKDSDFLVLEANHDVHMIEFCSYPYYLKQRILSDFGHLSNDAAGDVLCRILSERKEYCQCDITLPENRLRVMLAHLSRENNFPEMAYQTIKNRLEEEGLYIGRHVDLGIVVRDQVSPVYIV